MYYLIEYAYRSIKKGLSSFEVKRYETMSDATAALAVPSDNPAVSGFTVNTGNGRMDPAPANALMAALMNKWRNEDEPEMDGRSANLKQTFLDNLDLHYGRAPVSAIPAAPPTGATVPDTTQPAPQTQENDDMASKKAKKAKAPKKAKAANGTGERKQRELKQGMVFALKGHVLKNPSITDEALMAKLKSDGFDPAESSVATFRQDFVHSLRFLNLNGYKVPQPGE
jgi:hypothetical protein